MNDELSHYGTPRHSGRYPWGSGDDPEQRNKSFLGRVDELKGKGLSDKEIAEGMGMTIQQLRARKSLANAEIRKSNYVQALKWKEKGMSNGEIGRRLGGLNESSVRALLDPAAQERSERTVATANMLKKSVDEKGYIDIGAGVERHIDINRTKLMTAVTQLKDEGYMVTYVPVQQLGTGKNTTVMVLSKPKDSKTREVMSLHNQGLDDNEISKRLNMDEDSVKELKKAAYHDVFSNKDNIKMITDHSEDGGQSFIGLEPIRSIDSSRVNIRYGDEGGRDKDGLIELRRGVSELSLGNARYAQVRIGVDGTHYLKGMAVYSDDIPKGFDIIYNTNKNSGTPKGKVFKEMKVDAKTGNIDPDNPFGANVRQQHFITDEGLKIKGSDEMLSLRQGGKSYADIANIMKVSESTVKKAIDVKAVNIVNQEGEWRDKWSKSLSSQMLSKQAPALAKRQLDIAYNIKKEGFDEIMSLTNPAVRKKLLESFGDDCDSAAVHLKAAALPRSGWHALIPFPTMKETEVYAPNFRDGEKIVLIRYPHGGLFEIPELTVNNKHQEAKQVLDRAKDAIGIHPKVAEKLSGADFDGDAVLAIPNNSRDIKYSASLKALKDFDPKIAYKPYDGMQTIDGGVWNESLGKVIYKDKDGNDKKPNTRTKGMKMGDVSNLITDMTIRGANFDDIARAVKHSMVVIDSEKHHLDYKTSYIENGIPELKKKYQGGPTAGASTLISKASSESRPLHREEGMKVLDAETGKTKRVYIDPKTGEKLYQYTGQTYTKLTKLKDGTIKTTQVPRTVKSTKMYEERDAHKLSSGTPMEEIYATHANKLKALGNEARKAYINTESLHSSPEAKQKYAPEVSSLKSKLNIALKNAPLERRAQILANARVDAKREANPDMDADEIKKLKSREMAAARTSVGAKKKPVEITDREWEAIQAGAISNNTLMQILNNTDIDRVKQLATPRGAVAITPAKRARAERLLESGHTQSEVADAIGVSVATLAKIFND